MSCVTVEAYVGLQRVSENDLEEAPRGAFRRLGTYVLIFSNSEKTYLSQGFLLLFI